MKKIFLFLCICAFFISGIFSASVSAEEKILDFASEMTVQTDGSALVTEKITINAENVKIRRGIYRDIPDSPQTPVELVSLSMDGFRHPYFIEKSHRNLRVNFGNDDYIQKGIHTYELVYKIIGAPRAFDDYDEIYWNVTGNGWSFPIEQASFRIILPSGAEIKSDLVSTYTGKYGSKSSDAVKIGDNFFKTSKVLQPGEGFSAAIPFSKGIVRTFEEKTANKELPSFMNENENNGKKNKKTVSKEWPPFMVFLFLFLTVYYFYTWYKSGREPSRAVVTEFAPPKGISAAFMRCLWKRREDRKMFATALVSLAMKEKIEIKEESSFLNKSATLKIKDRSPNGLSEEEKHIISSLFSGGRDLFALAQSNWPALNSCMSRINRDLCAERKKYINPNVKYITFPVLILLLMQTAFIAFLPFIIFVNLHYSAFLAIASKVGTNKLVSVLMFLGINGFYFIFFSAMLHDAGRELWIMEGAFVLSLWGLIIYSSAIDNLTDLGKEVMPKIQGFYRYMSIAEEHRVALSNPLDAEKIFADFLPYAFALDMENKWMKEFENSLPRAVTDKYVYRAGGRNAIAGGLILAAINSAAPRNSGGGRGGSGGGGFSGGGFGGGGGGGR